MPTASSDGTPGPPGPPGTPGPPGPPGGPGGPPAGGPPPCWPPPCVPVDGGLGFLVAAGAALGGKKLYDLRKNNNNEKLS